MHKLLRNKYIVRKTINLYKNINSMIFLHKSTLYKDVIHKSIGTSVIADAIINTEIFQRLRNLHQLGVTNFYSINANGNRFEHSIGVYSLASKLLFNLSLNSTYFEINKALVNVEYIRNYLLKNHELEDTSENINLLINLPKNLLDDYLIELVKIAGLVHDLGHCSYSHLFDSFLNSVEKMKNCDLIDHENRSIALFKIIINNTNINHEEEIYKLSEFVDEDAFNFISELIIPNDSTPNNFIFQIISNLSSGLDVDKLDYLLRDSFYLGRGIPFDLDEIISHAQVINNNICFPEKISYEISTIFRVRYDLHKRYYNNCTVVKIECMINVILEKLDTILHITDNLLTGKLDQFITLSDATILTSTKLIKNLDLLYPNNQDSIYSKHKIIIDDIDILISRIYQRNFFQCLHTQTYNTSVNIDVEIKLIIDNLKLKFDVNKIKIITRKIGLVSGNKPHPYNNIYFYDKNQKAKIVPIENISNLISPHHQEIILYFIYID